ncbi:MAG: DMT family transporter [Clostridiales bacterium]|nr:DMT family transporter [Clostridiales bacterium]
MKKINPMIIGIIPFAIFGLSFLFTKVAIDSFDDVFHLLGLRFLLAVLGLTVMMLIGVIKIDMKGKSIKALLLVALFQPIFYFTFETFGIKYSSSSQAGVMIAFIPVVVTLFAVVFLKERTNRLQLIFIFLSVIGVLIMNSDVTFTLDSLKGTLFLMGAVLSAAFYQVLSRHASKEYSSLEITYIMMCVGAIFFNIIGLYNSFQSGTLTAYLKPLITLDLIVPLLYLGILSSVFAFFLINYVLSHVAASKASVLANLTTIIAIVAGVLFLDESFSMIMIVGSVLILIGVYGTARVKVK